MPTIAQKLRYWFTRNPDVLAEPTDNGVQPLDPPQDVDQSAEVCDGDR